MPTIISGDGTITGLTATGISAVQTVTSVAGVTTGTLAIANGGTGATTAGTALSNLGGLSGSSSQLAKAFVQWQGSNGTINRSYNVSSVTRNGTGNYAVAFSTALAASYAIVLGCNRNNGRTDAIGLQYYGQTTTSVNIDTYLPAIRYEDVYTADLVCFD